MFWVGDDQMMKLLTGKGRIAGALKARTAMYANSLIVFSTYSSGMYTHFIYICKQIARLPRGFGLTCVM